MAQRDVTGEHDVYMQSFRDVGAMAKVRAGSVARSPDSSRSSHPATAHIAYP